MRYNLLGCVAVGLMLTAFAGVAQADNRTTPRPPADSKPATAKVPIAQTKGANTASPSEALRNAAAHGKYAFIFFYISEDTRTKQLREIFDSAVAKIADRADSIVVRVGDPSARDIVNRFKVGGVTRPIVFSVAPNGAVIRTFRSAFSEDHLVGAFASPGMAKLLKPLQDGKMTFLCVQNNRTNYDAEAMKGVNDFNRDPRYASTTAVVTIDPADQVETVLLRNLKIDPNTPDAVTVLLAPPGKIVGTFTGATDKRTLLASVLKAAKKKPCCAGKKGGCKKPTNKKG